MKKRKFKPPNGYYVYEWFRVIDDHVFYVGKGKGDRVIQLRPSKRNRFFLRYIQKHECGYRIVKDSLTEEEAYILENALCQKYKLSGQCECNLADTSSCSGGGALYGELNGMYGKTHTPEVKKLLHDINSDGRNAGENNSQYHVSPSERMDPDTYQKWKEKQKARKIGGTNPNAHYVLEVNIVTKENTVYDSIMNCARHLLKDDSVLSARYSTEEKMRYMIKHSNKTKAIYNNKVFVIFKKQNPINKDNTVSSLEGRKIRYIPPYKKM